MALTRVRNNQVYNSDINAATKLQPASITGGLLAANFTYSGNLTVGNLIVNGLTTTVDTTNLVIADPLVVVNRNQSGSPSYDLGFIFGRGNQTNTAMIWEETAQQFQLQYTTESTAGTTFGTINNSGFANLQVYGLAAGNATITTATITNNIVANTAISGGTINNTTIGATTPNTGAFTTLTTTGSFTSGNQLIGYLTGAIGANTPNTVVATSVTTSSGGQHVGYFTGAIGANTANTGNFTTVVTTSNLYAGGNIIAASGTASTIYTNGALVVTGGAGVSGQLVVNTGIGLAGNGTIYTSQTTATVFNTTSTTVNAFQAANTISMGATTGTTTVRNNLVAPSFTASSGGNIEGYINGAIGANTANSGAFTTVTTTGTIVSQGTITGTGQVIGYHTGAIGANTANSGAFTTTSITSATNTSGLGTGALVVTQGGASIQKDLYVGGNIYVANIISETSQQLVVSDPLIYLSANSGTYNYEIGFYSHFTGGNLNNYQHTGLARNHVDSRWYLFSNLSEPSGGVVNLADSNIVYDSLSLGTALIQNTTVATNTTSGALQVSGGAGIAGSLYAGSIQNTPIGSTTASTGAFTTLTATTLTTSSTIVSQGIITGANQVIGYFNGAIGANTANSGAFTTLTSSGIATISGNLVAASGTGSADTTSGALVVTGGVGVSGTLNSRGIRQYSTTANSYIGYNGGFSTEGASGSNFMYIQALSNNNASGVGIFSLNTTYNQMYSSGAIAFVTGATIRSQNTPTGGVQYVWIDAGGNLIANSTTVSTSTTTGALVVTGGVGISGTINIGGNINGTSSINVNNSYSSNNYPYSNTGDISVYTVNNSNLNVNFNKLVANLVVHGASVSGYQNLLVTNGSTGQVGIKIAPDQITGNASLQINSTDSIILPSGSTAQRPSNGVAGMFRYNNNTNQLEYYSVGSSSWVSATGAYTTISEDSFTGDGNTTVFTLSQTGTTNGVIVSINGLVQIPITAYSVSGTALTFTEAPLATDIIDARTIVSTSVVTSIATGTSAVGLLDTGAGTGNVYINTNGTYRYIANTATGGSNYFRGGIAPMMTPVALTSGANTIVDSFSASTFTGAKYVVKMVATSGAIQSSELLVVSNATVSNYSVTSNVYIGAGVATLGANVSGGIVYIVATASTTGATATLMPTYMPI